MDFPILDHYSLYRVKITPESDTIVFSPIVARGRRRRRTGGAAGTATETNSDGNDNDNVYAEAKSFTREHVDMMEENEALKEVVSRFCESLLRDRIAARSGLRSCQELLSQLKEVRGQNSAVNRPRSSSSSSNEDIALMEEMLSRLRGKYREQFNSITSEGLTNSSKLDCTADEGAYLYFPSTELLQYEKTHSSSGGRSGSLWTPMERAMEYSNAQFMAFERTRSSDTKLVSFQTNILDAYMNMKWSAAKLNGVQTSKTEPANHYHLSGLSDPRRMVNSEGFSSGYAYFLHAPQLGSHPGSECEGIVMLLVSSSPMYNFLSSLALEIAPSLCRGAHKCAEMFARRSAAGVRSKEYCDIIDHHFAREMVSLCDTLLHIAGLDGAAGGPSQTPFCGEDIPLYSYLEGNVNLLPPFSTDNNVDSGNAAQQQQPFSVMKRPYDLLYPFLNYPLYLFIQSFFSNNNTRQNFNNGSYVITEEDNNNNNNNNNNYNNSNNNSAYYPSASFGSGVRNNVISNANFVLLHSLLLQEENIIFIGRSNQHASALVLSSLALIAPFTYEGIVIPFIAMPSDTDKRSSEADERLVEKVWVLIKVRRGVSHSFLIGSTCDIVPLLTIKLTEKICQKSRPRRKVRPIFVADGRTGSISQLFLHQGAANPSRTSSNTTPANTPSSFDRTSPQEAWRSETGNASSRVSGSEEEEEEDNEKDEADDDDDDGGDGHNGIPLMPLSEEIDAVIRKIAVLNNSMNRGGQNMLQVLNAQSEKHYQLKSSIDELLFLIQREIRRAGSSNEDDDNDDANSGGDGCYGDVGGGGGGSGQRRLLPPLVLVKYKLSSSFFDAKCILNNNGHVDSNSSLAGDGSRIGVGGGGGESSSLQRQLYHRSGGGPNGNNMGIRMTSGGGDGSPSTSLYTEFLVLVLRYNSQFFFSRYRSQLLGAQGSAKPRGSVLDRRLMRTSFFQRLVSVLESVENFGTENFFRRFFIYDDHIVAKRIERQDDSCYHRHTGPRTTTTTNNNNSSSSSGGGVSSCAYLLAHPRMFSLLCLFYRQLALNGKGETVFHFSYRTFSDGNTPKTAGSRYPNLSEMLFVFLFCDVLGKPLDLAPGAAERLFGSSRAAAGAGVSNVSGARDTVLRPFEKEAEAFWVSCKRWDYWIDAVAPMRNVSITINDGNYGGNNNGGGGGGGGIRNFFKKLKSNNHAPARSPVYSGSSSNTGGFMSFSGDCGGGGNNANSSGSNNNNSSDASLRGLTALLSQPFNPYYDSSPFLIRDSTSGSSSSSSSIPVCVFPQFISSFWVFYFDFVDVTSNNKKGSNGSGSSMPKHSHSDVVRCASLFLEGNNSNDNATDVKKDALKSLAGNRDIQYLFTNFRGVFWPRLQNILEADGGNLLKRIVYYYLYALEKNSILASTHFKLHLSCQLLLLPRDAKRRSVGTGRGSLIPSNNNKSFGRLAKGSGGSGGGGSTSVKRSYHKGHRTYVDSLEGELLAQIGNSNSRETGSADGEGTALREALTFKALPLDVLFNFEGYHPFLCPCSRQGNNNNRNRETRASAVKVAPVTVEVAKPADLWQTIDLTNHNSGIGNVKTEKRNDDVNNLFVFSSGVPSDFADSTVEAVEDTAAVMNASVNKDVSQMNDLVAPSLFGNTTAVTSHSNNNNNNNKGSCSYAPPPADVMDELFSFLDSNNKNNNNNDDTNPNTGKNPMSIDNFF